jgi:hypothetical protein
LLLGGIRMLERRPLIAGILFGLTSFKPQFALLIPLALIAAAQWRCLLAAVVTVAALVLVSAWLFGTGTWFAWIEGLPADRLIVALLLAFLAVVTLTTRFFWVCGIALILFFVLVVRRTSGGARARTT